MQRIKSILKVSEQGVSRPFLCLDETGGVRWCKGSHTGFRSLVSEWVCARLARETDVGEAVLPLETIRRVMTEGCHG